MAFSHRLDLHHLVGLYQCGRRLLQDCSHVIAIKSYLQISQDRALILLILGKAGAGFH